MTTTTPAATVRHRGTPGIHLSFVHVLHSEWIKLRTLRSTVWSYLIVIVMALGMALLGSTQSSFEGVPGDQQTQTVIFASTFGIYFGQLVVAVLGVLVISGEYSTGMIRSTITAVPKRLPALWAKAIVLFITTFVVGAISSFGSIAIALPILAGKGIHADWGDSALYLTPLSGALYLALLSIFALGIGAILRNSAGGIAAVLGILLLLPTLWMLIPGQWAIDASPYLLPNAGSNFFQAAGPDATLEPWQSLIVIVVWVAVSLAGAAVLLKRRDA